tara:strand:- start:72 stop:515 length:444 start_codon:yes stop_codon:yes gene_type:complete
MEEEQSISNIKVERSIFWKIYFCFMVYICVWATNENLNDENFGIIDFIDILMMLIWAIGLFGYVFSKRIYKQSFWIYFFGIYLAFCLVHPFLSEIEFVPDDPELSATENKFIKTFALVFAILLSLPSYIGLLLYGLPSNKLWKDDSV